MPPKKKRKFPPPPKPGIAKQHIFENYEDHGIGAIKNGHILWHFLKSEKSLVKTVNSLKSSYNINALPSNVVSLVDRSINYYKCLKDETQMKKFRDICDVNFLRQPSPAENAVSPGPSTTSDPELSTSATLVPQPATPSNSVSLDTPSSATRYPEQSTPATLVPQPATPSNSVSLDTPSSAPRQRMQLTQSKEKLYRLDFMSASKNEILKTNSDLKKKLKKPRKVINQAIQRKIEIIENRDKEIKLLKEKLMGQPLAIELAETKLELARTKDAHNKLKQYQENQKKVPASKHMLLQQKLKEKNDMIATLENDRMILREQIEELKSKDT
jgi:hypothetical protein